MKYQYVSAFCVLKYKASSGSLFESYVWHPLFWEQPKVLETTYGYRESPTVYYRVV